MKKVKKGVKKQTEKKLTNAGNGQKGSKLLKERDKIDQKGSKDL